MANVLLDFDMFDKSAIKSLLKHALNLLRAVGTSKETHAIKIAVYDTIVR